MTRLLLDTHVWAWAAIDDQMLSRDAARAIEDAAEILLSPVSLYEIGQKVRLGKWDEMIPVVERMWDILSAQGTVVAPLTAEIALDAGQDPWPHRDPFDRVIAATARLQGLVLVTADRAFSTAPGVRTIW